MPTDQIRSIYRTVAATTAGTEVTDLLGGVPESKKGIIEQVVVRASAGGGTDCDIQIRYIAGDSNKENLVYDFTAATYTHIDSNINAPFDTGASTTFDGDLILFLDPQANGTLEVRIDMRILD